MNKALNVIVTGCGGDIGQSIGKILLNNELIGTVVGTDMGSEHFGYLQFKNFEIVPACTAGKYFDALGGLIHKYNIDLIIPTSEPEIKEFCQKGFTREYAGTKVIMASENALRIGFDKLATIHFLKENDLDFPETKVIGEGDFPMIPCIIKSRAGSGSKNIFKVSDEDAYAFYKKRFPGYIAQELLLPDDEEYTCGLYRNSRKEIAHIVIKRKLVGDSTGFGEVVSDKRISQLLTDIAERMDLHGSINVQLRNTGRGPVVFEINPRFSSTVFFRHLLGFDDVIWSIQNACGLPQCLSFADPVGKKIYRGYEMKIQ